MTLETDVTIKIEDTEVYIDARVKGYIGRDVLLFPLSDFIGCELTDRTRMEITRIIHDQILKTILESVHLGGTNGNSTVE